MNLRTLAALDNRLILNDPQGFSHSCEITSPDNVTATCQGFFNYIGAVVDPETGAIQMGEFSNVDFNISDLVDTQENGDPPKFTSLITGIDDTNRKPWRIRVVAQDGKTYFFKVTHTAKDRGHLNMLTCYLEYFKEAE